MRSGVRAARRARGRGEHDVRTAKRLVDASRPLAERRRGGTWRQAGSARETPSCRLEDASLAGRCRKQPVGRAAALSTSQVTDREAVAGADLRLQGERNKSSKTRFVGHR